MTNTPTLLGLCGALRTNSYNRKLLHQAAHEFGPAKFIEADLSLPLYNGDVEAQSGIPGPVQKLAHHIADADAVVITTPEYNRSLSGVLKNALDWISRVEDSPWHNKPVAIMSATAGRSGGERAQSALRLCLTPFQVCLITGPEVLVAQSFEQFDDDGQLKNERYQAALATVMQNLRSWISTPSTS